VLLERSIRVLSQALGTTHVEVARLKHNLAVAFMAQRRYGSAEPLLVEALPRLSGAEHAIVLSKLAYVYSCVRPREEAAGLYRQAIAEFHDSGPLDPEFARTLQEYARLIAKNDRDEARRLEHHAKWILGQKNR
jgi:Tfp pilus assembly protein PilF